MTLDIFRKGLDKYYEKYFSDEEIKRRLKRLEKNKKNPVSFKGLLHKNELTVDELEDSAIRTYGSLLQEAGNDYANTMLNIKKPMKKNIMSIRIDILFKIKSIIYNLESKININLDSGKSVETKKNLTTKDKAVKNGYQCETNNLKVVSKVLVWTSNNKKTAAEIAKFPLSEKDLMGSEDFFELFGQNIKHDDFTDIIIKDYHEKIMPRFKKAIEEYNQKKESII